MQAMGMKMTMNLTPPWEMAAEQHPFKRALLLEPVVQLSVEAAFVAARAAGAKRHEAVGMLYAQCLLAWANMPEDEAQLSREHAEGFHATCFAPHDEVA